MLMFSFNQRDTDGLNISEYVRLQPYSRQSYNLSFKSEIFKKNWRRIFFSFI